MGNQVCSNCTNVTIADIDESPINAHELCVRARARDFPRLTESAGHRTVADMGSAGGECFLLLERCKCRPRESGGIVKMVSGISSSFHQDNKAHPFVKAWVEGPDGSVLSETVSWPVRRSLSCPTWFSAKRLGFRISEAPAAAKLRLQVLDASMSGALIGELSTPIGQLPGNRRIEDHKLSPGDQSGAVATSVTFQVLDSSAVLEKRTVFFIRHGESIWNEAQAKNDFATMARTTDHSLSSKGVKQAEALSGKLEKALQHPRNADGEDMATADAYYVSPLTRAIQTAVIGLGPMLDQRQSNEHERGEFMLMGSAREKQNLGGLDSMSTKIGAEILQHTHRELGELYGRRSDDGINISRIFNGIHWDVADAEEDWWCFNQSDSKEDLTYRLEDFMSQLLYTPHRKAVVVGHSHFFREVFKTFLSKDLPKAKTTTFTRDKMDNCGVVRLELDPTRGFTEGPITSIKLVLDSEMLPDGKGGMLSSCCTAAPEVGNVDIRIDKHFDENEAQQAKQQQPARHDGPTAARPESAGPPVDSCGPL